MEMNSWIENEFKNCQFADLRLKQRILKMTSQLSVGFGWLFDYYFLTVSHCLPWVSPEKWLGFIESKNNTSHAYDEEVALKVYAEIEFFLAEVTQLLETLEK